MTSDCPIPRPLSRAMFLELRWDTWDGGRVFSGRAPGSYHIVFPISFWNSQNKSCSYDNVLRKACSWSGGKKFYNFDLVSYLWGSLCFGAGRSFSCQKKEFILEAPESFVVYRQHTTSHFSLINCSHLRTVVLGFHKGFLDRIKQC